MFFSSTGSFLLRCRACACLLVFFLSFLHFLADWMIAWSDLFFVCVVAETCRRSRRCLQGSTRCNPCNPTTQMGTLTRPTCSSLMAEVSERLRISLFVDWRDVHLHWYEIEIDMEDCPFDAGAGSSSRKRAREAPINLFSLQSQPPPPTLVNLAQLHTPPPAPVPASAAPAACVVSTGLGLSLQDQQQEQQLGLAKSASSHLPSSLLDDLASQINQQNEEIDQFLRAQVPYSIGRIGKTPFLDTMIAKMSFFFFFFFAHTGGPAPAGAGGAIPGAARGGGGVGPEAAPAEGGGCGDGGPAAGGA